MLTVLKGGEKHVRAWLLTRRSIALNSATAEICRLVWGQGVPGHLLPARAWIYREIPDEAVDQAAAQIGIDGKKLPSVSRLAELYHCVKRWLPRLIWPAIPGGLRGEQELCQRSPWARVSVLSCWCSCVCCRSRCSCLNNWGGVKLLKMAAQQTSARIYFD